MSFILREAEKIICAVLFLAMTFLGFANVVVRYGTNYSLAVTEELLTNGFLLLTVFGAAVAARRGDHLAVTLVHDMLPPVLQRVVFLISLLLSLGLLAMSAWFSWQSVTNMMDSGIRSYGLGLPAWYYQIGVPFGFALVLIRYLQHGIDVMRGDVDDTGLPDV